MCWGSARICCPIPTTSRLRAGTKNPARDGARIGGRSRPGFRPRCVSTVRISGPRSKESLADRSGNQERNGRLETPGKGTSLCGVIAGWETQIGRDFETDRPLGYRALSHRGFSENNPPKDPDLERVPVVKEFIELWANSLHAAGIPREKIFCHIAFTAQGLRTPDAKESYAQKVHFALPEVAFSSAYRPGFSTYPEGSTFKEIYAVLARTVLPAGFPPRAPTCPPPGCPASPRWKPTWGGCSTTGR